MKIVLVFFLALSMLVFAMPVYASQATVWLKQASAGGDTGADCSNAHAVSFFNSSGNWGAGSTQIGMTTNNTVVHLCPDTFTTQITAQGSGSAGHVITIIFDMGAKFSAATWTDNTGVINISSKSYILIDGGTTCGETAFGVTTPCNGIIEATNNGSSPTYANQRAISGIYANDCSHCEIRNLNLRGWFIRVQQDTQSGTMGACGCGIQSDGASDSRWHNNIISEAADGIEWNLDVGEANFEVDHNVFFHDAWATGWAPFGTGNVTNLLWHDNEAYDWYVWIDATHGPGAGDNHLDGLHLYTNSQTGNVIGVEYYNNYLHGDPGDRFTAFAYYEGVSGCIVGSRTYNNVFAPTTNVPTNAYVNYQNCNNGFENYNNVYVGPSGSGYAIEMEDPTTTGSSKNNIFITMNLVYWKPGGGTSLTASDYNDYYNNGTIGFAEGDHTTLANWQSFFGQDSHSINTNPSLTAFVPSTSSVVYHTGVDLFGLGITALNTSPNGVARGSGSPWTMGPMDAVVIASNPYAGRIGTMGMILIAMILSGLAGRPENRFEQKETVRERVAVARR